GVVTSIRVRLHSAPRLLAGFIEFAWEQAAGVWDGLRTILADAPDELTIQSGILPGLDGALRMFLFPVWSGDQVPGEKAIDELRRLGTPLVSTVGPMTYPDLLGLFDPSIVDGRHYAIRTRSVANFTPDVISALAEAGAAQMSPLSLVSVHHFHGA